MYSLLKCITIAGVTGSELWTVAWEQRIKCLLLFLFYDESPVKSWIKIDKEVKV